MTDTARQQAARAPRSARRDAALLADALRDLGSRGVLWDDVDAHVWVRTGVAYARHIGCAYADGTDTGAYHYMHRRTDRTHRPTDRTLAVVAWTDRTDRRNADVRGLRARIADRAPVVTSRDVSAFVVTSSAAWDGVRGIGAHVFACSDPNADAIRARARDARVDGYAPHTCPRERRTGAASVRLTARWTMDAPTPENASTRRVGRAMARLNDARMDTDTRTRNARERADDVRAADLARAWRAYDACGR